MKSFRKFILLGTASSLLLAAGCGEIDREVRAELGADVGRVDASLDRFGERPSIRAGGAQLSEGIFVAATPERSNAAALLPASLQTAGAVRLESRDELSLPEIANRLSEATGIQHVVALGPTGKIVTDETGMRSALDVTEGAAVNAATGGTGPNYISSEPKEGGETLRIRPNLRGPLSEVLNELSSNFEVEWTYSDGRVIFQDYVTRQYQIAALPTTTNGSSQIGSNNMTSSSATTTDMWSDIRTSLQGLIGQGSNMSISSGTGLITVTAKVSDQDRVAKYVKEINGTLSQQITFDVNVLTVTLTDSDNLTLDISAAFNGTNDAGGGFANLAPDNNNMGSINIGVVDGDFSLNALARALSSQGKVSVNTRAGATTSNNRMVPVEIVDTVGYVKESEISYDSDDRQNIERTVDQVTTGFQLQILPRVMNNNDIMVQYSVRLSELIAMRNWGSEDNSIQLPEVSTTSFEQQAVIRNGQTLVLAGFERNRAETLDEGPDRARLGLFGGKRAVESKKVATVLLITPRLVNRQTPVRAGN